MPFDFNGSNVYCSKCGKAYTKTKGTFSVSYGQLYKGMGFLPYCKDCVDDMYEKYYNECGDDRLAVRQMCRKLDLYWNQSLFNAVANRNSQQTIMSAYIKKTNEPKWAGKSYDDTLREYGALWTWGLSGTPAVKAPAQDGEDAQECASDAPPESIKSFWGPGYSDLMYWQLDERYKYWLAQYPEGAELSLGEEALLRQVCNLEISIAQNRSKNKSIEKEVSTLNSVIASLNIRPDKKKAVEGTLNENTPFGVWIRRIEDTRPISEPDEQFKDVDGIRKYITVWFFGHLCKMLKIKNSYSKLYEEEMARLRVERPEYEGEDDEAVVESIFSKAGDDEVNSDERA